MTETQMASGEALIDHAPTTLSATDNVTFNDLGLPDFVLGQVKDMGFTIPTPIQAQAIPVALDGRDVVGIAQTGTGKTMAFALPMASVLERGKAGLVLAPTRELAAQIEEDFRKLGARTALLIGGAPMGKQVAQLRGRPDVIVATPGRLEDHLQQRTLDLRGVTCAVLDEADRMLDMGFAPAIRRILDTTPRERQTMLFSATMPNEIADLARTYLRDPERIEIGVAGAAAENVKQELIVVRKDDKHAIFEDLLHEHRGSVLVFSRTRHGARKLARDIREYGHSSAEIHSDRTLAQRRQALHGFKNGEFRVLVATDIAARGIDVKEISLVINFDVPEHAEDYVHRIGRTGRAGHQGLAVTIVTPDQAHEVRDIEKLLKTELPLSEMSPMALDRPAPRTGPKPARGQGGGNRGFGGGGGGGFRGGPRGR